MPPRGRPPGRKSTTLSTPTPSSAISTPKPPSRQQSTPHKPKQGPKTTKKAGRPSRLSAMNTSQINPSPSTLDVLTVDSVSDTPHPCHLSHQPLSSPHPQKMETNYAQNGVRRIGTESPPVREFSVASDENSAVMVDASGPSRLIALSAMDESVTGTAELVAGAESSATVAAAVAADSSSQPMPVKNDEYVHSSSICAADAPAFISKGQSLAPHLPQNNGRVNNHINGAGHGSIDGPFSTTYHRHHQIQKNTNGKRAFSSSYADPNVDLEEIKYRQKSEDIDAYVMDLDFCTSQLALPNLTPQESRTLQLRQLDLSHQIRSCRHDRETLEAQRLLRGGQPLGFSSNHTNRSSHRPYYNGNRSSSGDRATHLQSSLPPAPNHGLSASALANVPAAKRARASSVGSGQDTISVGSGSGITGNQQHPNHPMANSANDCGYGSNGAVYSTAIAGGTSRASIGSDEEDRDTTNSLQRLGYWKCRLCESEKYMLAGAARQPSAPSKWPLKDMGKLMSHYFDMHTEHEPDERCAELGDALDRNRGPFEYWLRKSRAQRITDRTVIDKVVEELRAGRVPKTLRDLCRAAAAFPGA